MHKKVTTYTSAKYINTNNLACFFLFSELGISVEYSQAKKKTSDHLDVDYNEMK